MAGSLLALTFGVAAAGNFSMIGAGLALAKGRAAPVRLLGAIFAFIVAGAALTIAWGGVAAPRLAAFLEGMEFLLTLAAGPAFYLLIATLLGRTVRAISASMPALAFGCVFALFAIAEGDAPDIRFAALTQIAYSVAVVVMIFSPGSKYAGLRLARTLVAAMVLVHLVQAARIAAPELHALAPAVPIVMCLFALCVVFEAVAVLAARIRAKEQETPPVSMEGLRALMTADQAFLRLDYRLADLAAAADLTSAQISRTINDETASGFVSFLNGERLRHATDLLRSPQEARTSVEAIALLSGFRSRSAFYRAFVKEYGLSPAAYRKSQTLS
jgi:AraC-like DNA-binding protein